MAQQPIDKQPPTEIMAVRMTKDDKSLIFDEAKRNKLSASGLLLYYAAKGAQSDGIELLIPVGIGWQARWITVDEFESEFVNSLT